jgi:hypothetical protein
MHRATIVAAWIGCSVPQPFCITVCAVHISANRPDKKDMGVLKPGTPRNAVIAELETPVPDHHPKEC